MFDMSITYIYASREMPNDRNSDKRPNNLGTMNDVTQDRRPQAIMYSSHGWSKYVNQKQIHERVIRI